MAFNCGYPTWVISTVLFHESYLINPSNSPILQRSKQQFGNIKYLAQDHTAQVWCWRLNLNLEESVLLPVPSRKAAV